MARRESTCVGPGGPMTLRQLASARRAVTTYAVTTPGLPDQQRRSHGRAHGHGILASSSPACHRQPGPRQEPAKDHSTLMPTCPGTPGRPASARTESTAIPGATPTSSPLTSTTMTKRAMPFTAAQCLGGPEWHRHSPAGAQRLDSHVCRLAAPSTRPIPPSWSGPPARTR